MHGEFLRWRVNALPDAAGDKLLLDFDDVPSADEVRPKKGTRSLERALADSMIAAHSPERETRHIPFPGQLFEDVRHCQELNVIYLTVP
jgi:hypothetical protein